MEEQKLIRKRDVWFYGFVLGTWVVIGIALFYAFTVYTHLDLLKNHPCEACMNLTGMFCSNIDFRNYNPKGYNDESYLNLDNTTKILTSFEGIDLRRLKDG